MLLRTISNTKKFFQKTVENFKSFLSGGYERLPKNSPCSSFPCAGGCIRDQIKYSQSYRELNNENNNHPDPDSSTQQDDQKNKAKSKKKETSNRSTLVLSRNGSRVRDDLVNYQVERKEESKKRKIVYKGKRYGEFSRTRKEERSFLVEKKLKELEMLDKSNMEHVLDIEEVLHYYSRLTCPAYVDIVDRFFMDMYAELLNGQQQGSSRQNINSRRKFQRVGFN